MKMRFLLYMSVSMALVLLGWTYFIKSFPQVSDFSLQLFGDALDIVRPAQYEVGSPGDVLVPNPFSSTPLDLNAKANGSVLQPERGGYRNDGNDIFRNIQVISLPRRIDRRISMEHLLRALSVNWTYVDAIEAHNNVVLKIMDCIRSRRARVVNASLPPDFAWPQTFPVDAPPIVANDFQGLSCPSADDALYLPAETVEELKHATKISDPVPELRPLTCATRNFTDGPIYDSSLPPHMLLTAAKMACWYSHLQVLEKFAYASRAENDKQIDDVVFILEDDVNMERSILETLPQLVQHLPDTWDMLFLGHCWSDESQWPPLVTLSGSLVGRSVSLHPSKAPKCTHAYAVTRHGALKLVRHLQYPPFAFSRALDQAFAWLVMTGRVDSYSVVPSIVVQRKMTWSDVDEGATGLGSEWKDSLVDGILP